MDKFLKHPKLQICKHWYRPICEQQTEIHMNRPTENRVNIPKPIMSGLFTKTLKTTKNENPKNQ